MWCLQLRRKGVSLKQYMGKSFNFFSCVRQNSISFCRSVFPLLWVQQGTLQVRRSGYPVQRWAGDGLSSRSCPAPSPSPSHHCRQDVPGCRRPGGPQGSQALPEGQGVLCPRAALRCPAQGGRQNSSLLAGCACTARPVLGCWGEWGGSSSPPESSIPIQWRTGKHSLARLGFYSQSSFDVSAAGGLALLWRGSRERAGGVVRSSPSRALEAVALPQGRSRCPSGPCAFAQETFAMLSL